MIIEISLTIVIIIIIITEFIKYASEKYIPSKSGMLCNNKLDSYRDGFCSKNRDSNNFCMKSPSIKTPEVKYLGIKKLDFGQPAKNINNSLGITEDTLFNRDINSGYTLKYW